MTRGRQPPSHRREPVGGPAPPGRRHPRPVRCGAPIRAVDPVHGGGKVTAQASAWRWPALLSAEQAADRDRLDQWWHWCLSPAGRRAAATAAQTAGTGPGQPGAMLGSLVAHLTG